MRAVRTVLGAELRQLVRDRRALFTAVVLPALLYPLLFFGTGKLEELGEGQMKAREVVLAVDLSGAPADLADEVRAALLEREPIELRDVDASALRALPADDDVPPEVAAERRAAVRDLLGEEGHVVVTARTDVATTVHLWFDVKDEDAREGVERARGALRDLGRELAERARDDLLGGDPGAGLDPTVVDVASAEDSSGAALGRWLPFLAVLVVLSGGAYAALAVFAGEREAGTLETLLVQPVDQRAVAWGKFLAVLVVGLVTLAVNLASLLACAATGIADLPGFEGTAGGVGLARLAAALIDVPACVLLCALLCLVCGRARTFREGQMLVFPLTLAVIAPTAIVFQPSVELDVLWALVPFAGPALGLREALEGDLVAWLAVVVVLGHVGWCWLALSRVAGVLDAERVLVGGDEEAERAMRKLSARHAVRWGFVVVMTHFLVGGALQQWDLERGLLISLWVLFPAFALAIARTAPRPAGTPWHADLSLTLPRARHVLGALLVAPGLAALAREWIAWQSSVLPMPAGAGDPALAAALSGHGVWWLLFFFALTPAVCEELVFRGSLLSSFARDLSTGRVLAWQAAYFAAAHLSVYRIVPTAVLGALLALVTLRARSIVPAMVLHGAYNGLLVVEAAGELPWDASAPWARALPWLALPGALLLGPWRRRERAVS